MLQTLMAHGSVVLATLLALALAAAYVLAALPRLPATASAGLTAAISILSLGASLAMPVGLALPLVFVVMAVLFGHAAWLAGLRTGRARAKASSARTAGSRTRASDEPAASPRPRTQPHPGIEPAVQAPSSAVGVQAATLSPTAPSADRHTLGRYRIDRQLGRGAMGAVYLGHDPKIGRQVAIKTMALGREFEGTELDEARTRFFREAETAGRLQHNDIVTIFDAGEDQDLAFIAMEYLKGQDLQTFTQPGRLLPIPAVLRVVARVAEALAYAHSQGVVHRDVKPANVMLDLDSETVKVTDFGIARITDSSRTRTGMVLGTPSFMSPEQMAGRRVDGRSDLYSLGVMLFQLLTGRLPHQADSMAKLMYQIANDVAPDVRSLRPDLPEPLANIVALALEKRPEVRYADGRQMASDLREIESAWSSIDVNLGAGKSLGGIVTDFAPEAQDAADANAFLATVKFSRSEPRHNSGA